jgi:hypothetical protein
MMRAEGLANIAGALLPKAWRNAGSFDGITFVQPRREGYGGKVRMFAQTWPPNFVH